MFKISLLTCFLLWISGVSADPHKMMDPPYTLGQYAQGGVIFWLDPTAEHGLVAAIVDQDPGTGIQWYNNTYFCVSAFADGIYVGSTNTKAILRVQGEGNYAAKIASDYSVTVDGITYANWYLPSPCELDMVYLNMALINDVAVANGGSSFAAALYWASSDYAADLAACQDFSSGTQDSRNKIFTGKVRAIRAF